MEQSTEKSMSWAAFAFRAFARKHGVSKTTVQRWKDAGYVVMTGNKVDVARSEKLLRGRPAESKGGRAKGPVADDGALAYWIDLYAEGAREGGPRATLYAAIAADLHTLPAGASENDVSRVLCRHRDALRGIV